MKELFALTIADYNSELRTFNINKRLEFIKDEANNKSTTLDDPKTEAGNRTVPLPKELNELLRIHTKGHKPGDFIFPRQDKKMQNSTSAYNRLKRAQVVVFNYCEKQNIPYINLGFRPLRHTYATALYDANIDLKAAQYLLGHEDIKMTLDIYTHISKYRTMRTISQIDNLYKQSCSDNAEKAD